MGKYNTEEHRELLEKIIKVIRDHDGKPCPSDEVIAVLLNTNRKRVSHALMRLIVSGRIIKIDRCRQRNFRCAETGKETRNYALKKPQRQRIYGYRGEKIGATPIIKWVDIGQSEPWCGRLEWYDIKGRRLNDYGQHIKK